MCLGLTCQVVAVTGDGRALVHHGGRLTAVSLLTLDEPVRPGEWLLVHAGFALARLSEEQVADARELRATTEKGWT
jgi:hydrogenase expression/formation protein HypC